MKKTIPSDSPSKTSPISLIVRLVVSCAAMILIIHWSGLDWSRIPVLFHSARWEWIIAGLVMFLIGRWVSGIRWCQVANAVGFTGDAYQYFKLRQISIFFSAILPTTVGGDIVACHYLHRLNPQQPLVKGFMTAMVDRYMAVVWLVILGGGLLLLSLLGALQPKLDLPVSILWSALGILVGFTLFALFMDRFFHVVLQKKLAEKFGTYREMGRYLQDKGLLIRMGVMALAMHLAYGMCHFMFAKAVGIQGLPFWFFVFLYSFVSIFINLVPSLNGVGIREGGYIYLLAKVGIAKDLAFMFSLLWFAALMVFALWGGVYYFLFKVSNPISPLQSQEIPVNPL